MSLRIQQIEIVDTFGTGHAKFNPGTVTRIKGHNGSGKSSILRALGYLFEGGTDPSVIRKGADQSRIEIKLTDGTTITKVTRPKRARRGGEPSGYTTDLEITQPDGGIRPAPMSYINELSEHLAIDPSVLLRIDVQTVPGRNQLVKELTRLVPITFQPAEIETACQRTGTTVVPMVSGRTGHVLEPAGRKIADNEFPVPPEFADRTLDLDGLKKLAANVTEQRRRFGITRDDSTGAVNRLQRSLPEDKGEDVSKALAAAESHKAEIERQASEQQWAAGRQKNQAESAAESKRVTDRSDIDRDIDAKIRELERERSDRKAAVQQAYATELQRISEETAAALRRISEETGPKLQAAAAEVASLKERANAHQRAISLRQEIEIQDRTAAEAARKYNRLSKILENLDALRVEKLSNLPVDGLVIEDGNAYLDGIEWQNANLARRVEAVLQICTQLSGKLPLVLIDDCEHLDSATRKALEDGLAAAGYQVIEAVVVDDSPLQIETEDVPAAA